MQTVLNYKLKWPIIIAIFSFFTFCPLKKITSARYFKVLFPFYRLVLAVGEVSRLSSLY